MKYFVLSPTSSDAIHAEASRKALEAYSSYMHSMGAVELSKDIEDWLDEVQKNERST